MPYDRVMSKEPVCILGGLFSAEMLDSPSPDLKEHPIHRSQCTHPFELTYWQLVCSFRMPSILVVVVSKTADFVGFQVGGGGGVTAD